MPDCMTKLQSNYPGAQGAVVNDRDEIQIFFVHPQLEKTSLTRVVVSLAR